MSSPRSSPSSTALPAQRSAEPAGGETRYSVRIARGSIYLDLEACDRYLPGVVSVATVCRDGSVLLLPLHGAAAGGSLLKVRNARGDRVVHALEFLRTLGIDADTPELDVRVRWDAEIAGLVLQGIPAAFAPKSAK